VIRRLLAAVRRLGITPRQAGVLAAIALLAGVAVILIVSAVRSSRFGDMAMFVLGLAVILLVQVGLNLIRDYWRPR